MRSKAISVHWLPVAIATVNSGMVESIYPAVTRICGGYWFHPYITSLVLEMIHNFLNADEGGFMRELLS